jgi:hypothetical protein
MIPDTLTAFLPEKPKIRMTQIGGWRCAPGMLCFQEERFS